MNDLPIDTEHYKAMQVGPVPEFLKLMHTIKVEQPVTKPELVYEDSMMTQWRVPECIITIPKHPGNLIIPVIYPRNE